MVHTEEKEDAIQQLIRCSCYTVYRIDVEHRVETWQDKLFVLMSVAEGEGTLNGTRLSRLFFINPFEFKNIQRIHIRAGKDSGSLRISGDFSTEPENVYIRECHMHCHGA